MITSHLFIHDSRFHQLNHLHFVVFLKLIQTDQKIIQAPSLVYSPEILPYRPESVLYQIRIEMSKCVHKPTAQKLTKRLPLFWSVTWNFLLSFCVIDVNLIVSHIQISCQNHWLSSFSLELFQISVEVYIPLSDSVLQPLQSFSSVWHICNHEYKVFELHCDGSAFIYMLFTEIKLHGNWLDSSQDCSTGVTEFCFAAVPVLGISLRNLLKQSLLINFFRVSLSLVEADHIGVNMLHEALKLSLVNCSGDSIYIPTVD